MAEPRRIQRRRTTATADYRESKLIQIIGTSLNQDGYIQFGKPNRIGDALLIAEVRQAHKYAIDPMTIGAEEIAAFGSIRPCFNGA